MSPFSTVVVRVALAAVVAGACGEVDELPGEPDAGAPPDEPDAAPDRSGEMFQPDRLLDIEIELAAADWDELRTQTRSIFDVIGSSCLVEPPPRPYTWFPATVTIDGEQVANVGVRKKGFFGSLSETKPSLKLSFDEYVAGREYSSLERMTLNNAISDPSYVKQCLGYALFQAAGVPAPRCNFARVTVNGAYLGVFAHVESIRKPFLRRQFGDDDGNLYEGALSDFRPGWVDTFQRKTNEHSDPDRGDIEALVPVMELPDDELLAALETHFDLDAFFTFWAMELLISHPDGYARNTNNFYLYRDPTTEKWRFIPWGIDSILFDIDQLQWEDQTAPKAVWAEGALTRRLYQHPDTRDLYLDRLAEVLAAVWDEDHLLAEVDRMEALIRPHVVTGELAQLDQGLASVRSFITGRRAVLQAELTGPPPVWDRPLREPWCIDALGSVSATFDTTWGTIGADDPFAAGDGTLQLTVDGVAVPVLVGSTAGPDGDSGDPAVQVVAWLSDDTAAIVHVVVAPQMFTGGMSIPIDWTVASGYAVKILFPPGADPVLEVIGMVGDGTLELDAAGTAAGAAVTGRLDAVVFEPLF